MNKFIWAVSKLGNITSLPRYIRELPDYMRGYSKAITKWGDKMIVPFPEFRSLVREGWITGHGEEAVYEYLDSHLKKGDIFFDIGANAGFYGLLGLHKGATTFVFEPYPSTFRLLQWNWPIKIYPLAISDTDGVIYMEKQKSSGLNKVSPKGTVPVECVTLDTFCKKIKPTVIKIDVEGHEMQVFKGAKELLKDYKPTIIAEVTDESRIYLESLGYTSTLLGKTNWLFTTTPKI